MLKSWSVSNFKSIAENTTVSLAALNVFAGANSSGKSSFIQTILLIKQSFQSLSPNIQLTLNGPILGLGTFRDIKNSFTEDQEFHIGWEFTPSSEANYRSSNAFAGGVHAFAQRPQSSSVICDFTWSPRTSTMMMVGDDFQAESISQLQPELRSATISVDRAERDGKPGEINKFSVSRSDEAPGKRAEHLGITEPLYDSSLAALKYEVSEMDPITAREVIGARPEADIAGAYFRHFWPTAFGVRYNASAYRAKLLSEYICSGAGTSLLASAERLDEEVSTNTTRAISEWLENVAGDPVAARRISDLEDEPYIDADMIIRAMHVIRPKSQGLISRNSSSGLFGSLSDVSRHHMDLSLLQPVIESSLLSDDPNSIDFDISSHRSAAEAGEMMRNYFSNYVRYLGPLRDEPRSVYPREAIADMTDVGYKGEYTAAVLNLNAARIIRFLSPAYFSENSAKVRLSTSSLSAAVAEWMNYFGVATGVETSDLGKFGRQLQVRTEENGQPHDLTHVGVGVSQVLPIVVMALLAPPSSLLIFEQPELHLHPRVQSRLGDFFISLALNGKQCVLETHSEYLVDRFRLRIAESSDNTIQNLIAINFAERPHGKTHFKTVLINEYGAITNWPAEFFDQSEQMTEQILLAATAKRRRPKNATE